MHNPYIAIPAAALAAWIFGSVWYMALSKPYQIALGLNPDDCKDKKMPLVPMLVCFLAELAMAWILFTLIPPLGVQRWFDGVMTGLLLGVAFTALPVLVNNLFAARKPSLSLIDGGHWIGVAIIEAVVLRILI